MEFASLFRVLLRRKWIILSCTLVAAIVAFVLTINYKKQYKASSQLSTGFTISEELKLSNENFNIPQIEQKFNNVIENITSPSVLTLVSYHLILHDLKSAEPYTVLSAKDRGSKVYRNAPPSDQIVALISSRLDSMRTLDVNVPVEKAVDDYLKLYNYDGESLDNDLKVERYQRTDYINISYKAFDPNLAAFVVNTLVEEFNRFYGRNKHQSSNSAVTTLDSLVQRKKVVLDQKVAEKNSFMSSHGILDVNMEGTNSLSQISNLEIQLIDENGNLQEETYRVEQLTELIKNAQSKGLTTVAAPVDAAANNNTNVDYIRLRDQYNDLYAQYMQKGGTDLDMKRRLDEISQKMAKMNVTESVAAAAAASGQPAAGVVSIDQLIQKRIDANGQLGSTKDKVASIQTKLAQLRGGLTGMAARGANVQQFDKEIQLASADYTAAKDQLNDALNRNEISNGSFKQILLAVPPDKAEPSKRLLVIASAGISAFFLSCLVIIFMEFSDQSIKTPTQFRRLTNLPLLGMVSRVKFREEPVLERIAFLNEQEAHRDNRMLELLRKLRYEIESSGKKTFLVTSTEPQQGKTVLIQALSYILSLGKKRVLIIDTNFCNNDLTVGTGASPMLEKFDLNGKPFQWGDFRSLVSSTKVSLIDVVGCEGGDYTPSEILPKNHLLHHLRELKEDYDFIFLEGAPLNDFTDSKELSQYVDGILAIFSAQANVTPADRESIKFFEENRSKFVGAILNKVEEDNLEM